MIFERCRQGKVRLRGAGSAGMLQSTGMRVACPGPAFLASPQTSTGATPHRAPSCTRTRQRAGWEPVTMVGSPFALLCRSIILQHHAPALVLRMLGCLGRPNGRACCVQGCHTIPLRFSFWATSPTMAPRPLISRTAGSSSPSPWECRLSMRVSGSALLTPTAISRSFAGRLCPSLLCSFACACGSQDDVHRKLDEWVLGLPVYGAWPALWCLGSRPKGLKWVIVLQAADRLQWRRSVQRGHRHPLHQLHLAHWCEERPWPEHHLHQGHHPAPWWVPGRQGQQWPGQHRPFLQG